MLDRFIYNARGNKYKIRTYFLISYLCIHELGTYAYFTRVLYAYMKEIKRKAKHQSDWCYS